jgi:hypothetical protein
MTPINLACPRAAAAPGRCGGTPPRPTRSHSLLLRAATSHEFVVAGAFCPSIQPGGSLVSGRVGPWPFAVATYCTQPSSLRRKAAVRGLPTMATVALPRRTIEPLSRATFWATREAARSAIVVEG